MSVCSAILARHPKDVGGALIVGEAGGDEEEIRQPIYIFDRRRGDAFARPVLELDDQAFGPPADRAGEMQVGRGRAAAWRDAGGERRRLLVEPVDLPLE